VRFQHQHPPAMCMQQQHQRQQHCLGNRPDCDCSSTTPAAAQCTPHTHSPHTGKEVLTAHTAAQHNSTKPEACQPAVVLPWRVSTGPPKHRNTPQHTASMTHTPSRVCSPAGSLQLPAAALTEQSRDPSSPLSYMNSIQTAKHIRVPKSRTHPRPLQTHIVPGAVVLRCKQSGQAQPRNTAAAAATLPKHTHTHTKQNPRGGASGTQQCRLMIPPSLTKQTTRDERAAAHKTCAAVRLRERESVCVPRTHEE
jgi:hypothetical protein